MVSTQKKQGYHFIFQEKRRNFAPTSRGVERNRFTA